MKIGDTVQVYGQGPIGIVMSERKIKEWYDRGTHAWKSFSYYEVLISGEVAKIDPFVLQECNSNS